MTGVAIKTDQLILENIIASLIAITVYVLLHLKKENILIALW